MDVLAPQARHASAEAKGEMEWFASQKGLSLTVRGKPGCLGPSCAGTITTPLASIPKFQPKLLRHGVESSHGINSGQLISADIDGSV
jgi:hypothetical protein